MSLPPTRDQRRADSKIAWAALTPTNRIILTSIGITRTYAERTARAHTPKLKVVRVKVEQLRD